MRLIFVISLLSFAALGAFAQTPVGTPPPLVLQDNQILNIDSRLIMVPVSVTDAYGNPVKGLGVDNFSVREENQIQEISEVTAAEKVPLEIALLFDVSGSADPMFTFEQQTASKFLQSVMRPEDHATIFTIGESPVMVQSRNVASKSIETINSISRGKQFTAFYDSVVAAAKYLGENAPPRSRKVIIAITDGEDTNSEMIRNGFADAYRQAEKQKNTLTSKDLRELLVLKRDEIKGRAQETTLKSLQDSDTVFYSINPAGSSYKLNKMSQFGQQNLNLFAQSTGGTAFIPSFQPVDLNSEFQNAANEEINFKTLDTIFNRLASELQAQYLVQYYSDGEYPADKYVNVEVKVNLTLPQGVNTRARAGYYVK